MYPVGVVLFTGARNEFALPEHGYKTGWRPS
jgi:hypothetical protein